MKENPYPPNRPLVNVIESGLKIWVKSKCNHIEKLEIDINSSDISLLKGNISNIHLVANQINFQDLLINYIELEVGPIQIDIQSLFKIKIRHSFPINGTLKISGDLLKSTLSSSRWKFLDCWISKKLLGMESLEKINIIDDLLEVHANNLRRDLTKKGIFKIHASSGKIIISDQNSIKSEALPMEDSIKINKAFIKENLLIINGKAEINP